MKEITYARSKKDGIVFQSTILPMLSVESIRDNSGKIYSTIIPGMLSEFFDFVGTFQNNPNQNRNFKLFVVIADIILMIVSLLTRNIGITIAAVYFSIIISYDFFAFAKIVYHMKSKHGKERSTARYHSAEHMVLNAYRDLQRVPTLEEIKHYSRFSEHCGSREIIHKLVSYGSICVLISISNLIPILVYIALCIIVGIAISIAKSKGWLKVFQILITSKPSDEDLQVAIEGLKALQELDESLEAEMFEEDINGESFSIQIIIH